MKKQGKRTRPERAESNSVLRVFDVEGVGAAAGAQEVAEANDRMREQERGEDGDPSVASAELDDVGGNAAEEHEDERQGAQREGAVGKRVGGKPGDGHDPAKHQ